MGKGGREGGMGAKIGSMEREEAGKWEGEWGNGEGSGQEAAAPHRSAAAAAIPRPAPPSGPPPALLRDGAGPRASRAGDGGEVAVPGALYQPAPGAVMTGRTALLGWHRLLARLLVKQPGLRSSASPEEGRSAALMEGRRCPSLQCPITDSPTKTKHQKPCRDHVGHHKG